jgi:hypothetical protein
MNDMILQQIGGVQYATLEYYNRFGTNLSKAQGAISKI